MSLCHLMNLIKKLKMDSSSFLKTALTKFTSRRAYLNKLKFPGLTTAFPLLKPVLNI